MVASGAIVSGINPPQLTGQETEGLKRFRELQGLPEQETPAEPEQETQTQERRPITQPEVIRNQETGEITGYRLPDGRQMLFQNLPESQVINELKAVSPTPTPEGFVEGSIQQQAYNQIIAARKAGAIAAARIGQTEGVQAQPTPLDTGQATGAGLRDAFFGAAGGAILPAAAGAITGGASGAAAGLGSPASVVLGVGGAVIGFWRAYQRNIAQQNSDFIKAGARDVRLADTQLKRTISSAWAGGDKTKLADQFNQLLNSVDSAEAQIKADARAGAVFTDDATKELEYINYFNENLRPAYVAEMRAALQSPSDTTKALAWASVDDLDNVE